MHPIQVREGDLLAIEHGIIVHGCNAQGVMGSGIARLIRNKWPQVFADYRAWYEAKGKRLKLGAIQLVPVAYDNDYPQRPALIIANLIAQQHYGNDGRRYVDYEAISEGFMKLAHWSRDLGLPLHFPLIGCGLAGGDWAEVSRRIEAAAPHACKTLWVLPGTQGASA